MSKHLIDNGVLDTDWFLGLPPKLKALFFVLRLTCSGVGFRKMGFKKLSGDIGEEITREEFDKHFHGHAAWIGENEIWLHDRIVEQYKELSPKNLAHLNMARQVVERTLGLPLSPEAQRVVDDCSMVIRLSAESPSTVDRQSPDSRLRVVRGSSDPNITITSNNKDSSSLEGGVGETNADASTEPPPEASPPGIVPALEGEYTPAARALLEQVSHAAQEAWLISYPDGDWIRKEIHKHIGHKETNIDRNPHRSPGAKIGTWLGVGWKIREQARSPPGWVAKAPELDLTKITGFTE